MSMPDFTVTGTNRDGVGYKDSDINKWVVSGEPQKIMLCGTKHRSKSEINGGYYIMSDVSKAYDDANEVIEKARDGYNKTLLAFRSTIANDLKSISSSADKTVKEGEKLRVTYENTISTLTSNDMERAIENAERLAAALKLISELKSADVSFRLTEK